MTEDIGTVVMMLCSLLRWQGGKVFLTWFMHGCGVGLTSTKMNSSMSSSASTPLTWSMTMCVSTPTIMRGWCPQASVGQLLTSYNSDLGFIGFTISVLISKCLILSLTNMCKHSSTNFLKCHPVEVSVWLMLRFHFMFFCFFSGSWTQPSKYRWVTFYSTTSWLKWYYKLRMVPLPFLWSNDQTDYASVFYEVNSLNAVLVFVTVTVHLSHFYVKVSTAVWTECCHNIKTIVAHGWIVSSFMHKVNNIEKNTFFHLWSGEKEIDENEIKKYLKHIGKYELNES